MRGETTLKDLGIEFKATKSEDAFRKIHDRLKPGLENWLFNMTKDRAQATHFTSLALSTAYEKIDQYNPKWHISTWIYRIAYINFCLELRSGKRAGVQMVRLESDDQQSESGVKWSATKDLDRMLRDEWVREEAEPEPEPALVDHVPEAILELPTAVREAVRLKFYDGKSSKDGAAVMGISKKEFNHLIRSAKKSVKTHLEESEVRAKFGHLRESGRLVYPYSKKVLMPLASVYGVKCRLVGEEVVVRGGANEVRVALDRIMAVDRSIKDLYSAYSKEFRDYNPTEYMTAICAAILQALGTENATGRSARKTEVMDTPCARKAIGDAATVLALVGAEPVDFKYGQQEFRLPA